MALFKELAQRALAMKAEPLSKDLKSRRQIIAVRCNSMRNRASLETRAGHANRQTRRHRPFRKNFMAGRNGANARNDRRRNTAARPM
jgi:hypothetical protein